MFPFEIPPGTTVESLVTRLIPELHARLVGEDGPNDELAIGVRIEGSGSWTLRIRGRQMSVHDGEDERVSLWVHSTTRDVTRFTEDFFGAGRVAPYEVRPGGVATLTDPRAVKRLAMANGRIEIGVRDDAGERIAMVLGFGAAARRPIDPHDADAVIDAGLATIERVMRGDMRPEDVLRHGDVSVRGNRFLPMQLALALAPFWEAKR